MGEARGEGTAEQHTRGAPTPLEIDAGALLLRASAELSLAALNAALRPHGLWLPLVPLAGDMTLAQAVARNLGGRYQLGAGTLARALRAATLCQPDGTRLHLGGPTLKRATGYNLPAALVGGGLHTLPNVGALEDVTLHVRPLPPARHVLRLECPSLAAACALAHELRAARLGLLALALAAEPGGLVVLLAELVGSAPVVARQAAALTVLAAQAGATADAAATPADQAAAWQPFAQRAAQAARCGTARLDVTLPQAALASFAALAQQAGAHLLGDLGVGRLHAWLADPSPDVALEPMRSAARALGGAPCTEFGAHMATDLPVVPSAATPGPACTHAALLGDLVALLGAAHVLTRRGDLICYASDASVARAAGLALAVVLPATTAEVCAVLRLAHAAGVPVITRGAGSGLTGGATTQPGALLLVLTRLRTLTIDPAQQVAHVGAGVITAELQAAAAAHGLHYVPDPSSQGVSSLGGNIACNAGGPRCLKYGVTATYVLGLTVALADGTRLRVGDGLSAQGPDAGLLNVLVGSEGTLAVVTEATLRLVPPPAATQTTLALFDRLDDACATVAAIMAAGVLPASLELIDETALHVVEQALGLGLPPDVGALLLLLADGEPEAVAAESARLAALAQAGGARQVRVARDAAQAAEFWRARRSVAPAFARVLPNKISEDICVPVPRVAETVRRIKQIAARYDVLIPVFGHAGDGNLHPNVLFDARDAALTQRAWQAAEEIFAVALAMGGTLSGEHGIGTLKRAFLPAALGAPTLALHERLKARFDPDERLNPGKVLAARPHTTGNRPDERDQATN